MGLKLPPTHPCPETGCDGRLRKRDGRYGAFYGCTNYPQCTATAEAAHDGSMIGPVVTAEIKAARNEAHAAFDPLWEEAEDPDRARGWAYAWLAMAMGIGRSECHIKQFDVEQCVDVVNLCATVTWRDVEDWWRREGERREMFDSAYDELPF